MNLFVPPFTPALPACRFLPTGSPGTSPGLSPQPSTLRPQLTAHASMLRRSGGAALLSDSGYAVAASAPTSPRGGGGSDTPRHPASTPRGRSGLASPRRQRTANGVVDAGSGGGVAADGYDVELSSGDVGADGSPTRGRAGRKQGQGAAAFEDPLADSEGEELLFRQQDSGFASPARHRRLQQVAGTGAGTGAGGGNGGSSPRGGGSSPRGAAPDPRTHSPSRGVGALRVSVGSAGGASPRVMAAVGVGSGAGSRALSGSGPQQWAERVAGSPRGGASVTSSPMRDRSREDALASPR